MITTQINEQADMPNTYPLLMQHVDEHEFVVLFSSPKTGMVVSEPEGQNLQYFGRIGRYNDDWKLNKFEPFHGTLELRNS